MNKAKAFSLLLIFVSLTVSVSPPITAARMRDLRSAHLTEMTGAPSGYDEDSSGVAPTTTGDVPPPLPTDCDGVGPPIPACCLFGYVYYDDATVAGVAVHIESPHGTLDTLTTSGWASDEPYYVASLSTSPLNVSPGDVITITASYSDMVSTRTWTVQGAGQHVDLGLVTGFQSPGSVTELGAGESESESAMLHDHSRTAAAAPQGIPLTFIENVGQFDERARFQVRNGDTTLFLAKDALWVTMIEPSSQPVSTTNLEALATAGQETEMASNRRVNLKLSFVGANPHPRLEPLDKSAARVSFFTGNDPDRWHTDVPAWGGVRYVDLYPGVDLELRGQNGGLEQRLVVRESGSGSRLASHNSHLSDVRLRVEGVEDLALDGNHLKLTTALGDLALPLLTVEETNPDAEPAVRKIEDETYEVSFPFASAPSFTARFIEAAGGSALSYSTYLGGSGEDRPFDIALDSAGNVHIVGETSSTDFPITPGAYNASYGGDPTDVFVTKLSAGGSTLVYSTYLGGNDEDAGNGITVDSAGNVYLTGKTYSTNFPTTPGALDTTLSGGRDAFVAKLNAAGDALIYSTYLGGTNWDYGFCIAIDDSDNAYVGGFTHGSFPVTSGAAQTTFGGSGDGFAVKLSPDGRTLLYSTYLGGYSWEGIDGIVIDNAGNAYLASHTHSTDFPTTPGAWDRVCDNCQTNFSTDGAVAKLNADGSAFIYSTLIGGADAPGVDVFTDISIDSAGNAYLTGHTSSADFPTTTGALQPDFGGGNDDAVVVKLNADGSDLLYSTYLGGSDADRGYGIAIDNDGTAYLTGYTASTDFATVDPLQASNAGGYDAFVAKVNDAGSALLYSTYLGGSGDENCFNSPLGHADIALDRTRNIYLTGFTGSTDLPTTNNAYDMSFNGGNYDAFVTKIRMNECGWSLTSSLADGRHGHTATLLSNGRVLVVGGIQERTAAGPGLANAEIYDPIGGTWSATGSLKTGRWGHSATLLPDGRVLVVGGRDVFSGPALASVEVYDPVSGTWSSAAPLSVPRGSHTATRLSDGRVLVVGGRYSTSNPDVHASAEIYDPTSGTWSPTGSLNTPRESHSATLLSDGRVLVVNGYYQSWLASAEIYSPAGRTWSEIPPPLSCHGVAHTATLLADGRVLVVGGACGSGTPGISDGAEIYDPVASTWTANTDLPEAREVHTATLLPDGTVLIVGGDDGDVPRYDSALIYNPASGTWTSAGSLAIGRRNHTTTLLNDGRVLIVAGWGDTTTYLDHAEIYHAHCVASPPVAAFTAIPRSGNIPLDVHFTDQSSGDIIAWDWTFGDGGISGARHPEHEYTNDGTYSLALTVTGPGSSDTESKLDYITVIEPTWTFMLYLDGDNNLDRWLKRAFARLDAASANPHVAIVVQIDGPGSADTWRYKIQPGADHSWYMGELDMGDPQTLSDFILWARETYPADHTYLAVADHGRGTTGIAWDETTGNNEFITVSELWTALHGATDDGAKPLDVVHYDACLMAMLEDAYQIKYYTRYLVASENLTWGAFAYDAYAIPVTTTTTPLELATTVADAYHRAVTGYPHTISALDIGEVGTVADAVTDLANALMADLDAVRNHVTDSRNKAQKLDSRNYYDITNDDEYVDLYDLAWLLKENVPDNDVKNAAQDVMDKIADLVTTEYHESGVYHDNPRWDLDDTHGVSIYFPEDIWSSDYEDYLEHNLFRFTIDTQWDDFLHDHIGDPGFGILPPPPPPVLMYHLVYLPFVIR